MSNGLVLPQGEYKKVKIISVRVSELREEVSTLEKITKKLLEGKELTQDESDILTLLAAREEDTDRGWIDWGKFKRQFK